MLKPPTYSYSACEKVAVWQVHYTHAVIHSTAPWSSQDRYLACANTAYRDRIASAIVVTVRCRVVLNATLFMSVALLCLCRLPTKTFFGILSL